VLLSWKTRNGLVRARLPSRVASLKLLRTDSSRLAVLQKGMSAWFFTNRPFCSLCADELQPEHCTKMLVSSLPSRVLQMLYLTATRGGMNSVPKSTVFEPASICPRSPTTGLGFNVVHAGIFHGVTFRGIRRCKLLPLTCPHGFRFDRVCACLLVSPKYLCWLLRSRQILQIALRLKHDSIPKREVPASQDCSFAERQALSCLIGELRDKIHGGFV
jgi:hypothetical protein